MYVLLVIIYVIVALFLIMVVLLQSGRGASMGAAFGGAAQTMFGSRGKATGIEKTTVVAAVLFMVLSIALASLSAQTRSALDYDKETPKTEAGMAPQAEQKPAETSAPQQPSPPASGQPPASSGATASAAAPGALDSPLVNKVPIDKPVSPPPEAVPATNIPSQQGKQPVQ